MTPTPRRLFVAWTVDVCLTVLMTTTCFASQPGSQVVDRELRSPSFSRSKIGTSPVRKIAVYLPAGYDGSSDRYPVIYYFPDVSGSYRSDFDRNGAQGLFDSAIRSGVIDRFVFVTVDMNTPLG